MTPRGQTPEPQFFDLLLESPRWRGWTPGQFVMLRPESFGLELVWGRPFSICDADNTRLRVFFQRTGRGTGRMAKLEPGDQVQVWGPLGRGFALRRQDEAEGPTSPTLLLAGGVGIAPFVGLARRHPEPWRLELVFGHRPELDGYPFEDVAQTIRTQSFQEQGPEDIARFVGLLEERVATYASAGLVLACGPLPFLKTVQRLALAHGAQAQLSLENRMACGVGACLGCVTTPADPEALPVQVCTHGPAFWAHEIDLQGA